MGLFLSLSGVIGKSQNEVETSLANYAKLAGGGFQRETVPNEHRNLCVLKESNGNTSVFYPAYYLEWDKSSEYISKELNAPVFSFHIHDGDLWMYVLYFNGEIVDQFNPTPDYWNDGISQQEIDAWKGNAAIIEKYVPGVKSESVQNYLSRWDLDEKNKKAYENDQFVNEDWQLIDFMKKVGLAIPIDDDGNPLGTVYKFWTKELNQPLNQVSPKKWWKFW